MIRVIKTILFSTTLVVVLGSCYNTTKKEELSLVVPAQLGIDPYKLSYVDSMMQDYLNTERLVGGVYLVAKNGKVAVHRAFGYRNKKANILQSEDDLFRIASMTKPITAIAAMQLLEQGKFGMEDPLWWHLPEFREMEILEEVDLSDSSYTARKAKNEIRVKHLFNHTSGMGYGFQDEKLNALFIKQGVTEGFEERPISLEENTRKMAALPLMHEPGEKWTYGMSFDVLGRLVEVLSGQTLDEYFQQNIFDPLGMKETYFYLPQNVQGRLSSVYESTREGALPTTYELINYPIKGAKMYLSGGGDLTCTAKDYARFAQMVMNRGELDGNRIISQKSIEWMTTQQQNGGKEGIGWGFGVVEDKDEHKTMAPAGSNFWGGFFGTQCLMDPKNEIIAILMIQQYPNWEWNIHDKFHNIVYASLTDVQ